MASNPGAAQFEANSFASAVARAKQIAARISPAAGDAQAQGIKRPLDDGASFGEPDLKKVAGDSIGAQLRAISENQSFPSQSSDAARQAHEAAARVIANRQLGGNSQQDPNMPGPLGGPGMVVTEEFAIPDKMVGLVIGKGGEQITRLQAESGVKVQIAPDSGGLPNRPCTLTGPQHSIEMCKQSISQIIERGQTNGSTGMGGGMDGMGENVKTLEMSIPGPKVGLIIGKGGDTIRQLQETAGVKMVMIQDNNAPSSQEKPLRITGDPMKIQRAREMIINMLAEKEDVPRPGGFNDYGSQNMGGNMGGGGGGGGPPSGGGMDIGVPRQGVGLVIGKMGDMIKKIQTETGAKVQFKPDDTSLPDRTCSIGGSPDKCQAAIAQINNLLAKANIPGTTMRNSSRPDMGQGGGPGPYNNGGGGPRGGGMGNRFDNMFDQHAFSVPAEKCGLVIGKGGETIREINRQSGAHVELDRNPPPNMNEKVFNIKGNHSQIQHAVSLIQEKTGQHGGHAEQCPGPGAPSMMGGPGPNGPPGGPGPQVGPNGPGPQGPGYDQYGGQFNQANQPPQQPYGGAPQGWNAYGNQFPQQQSMANEQTNDANANAAAWAYYYATYGQGQGQQPATPQQPAAPQQQQMQQQQAAQPGYTPTANPQTQQHDYTEAWLQYYRCQGRWHEANMVLQHSQNQAAAAGATALSQGQQPGQP